MNKTRRIAEKLGERTGSSGDRDVVDTEEELSLYSSGVLKSSYQRASDLKDLLLEEYAGVDVAEAAGCRKISNDYGEVLHREGSVEETFTSPDGTREEVLSDLKLIHGIGPARERDLRSQGYRTVYDLTNHRAWGESAEKLLQTFRNHKDAMDTVLKRKAASDPLLLKFSGLFDQTDFAIIDIETLGLSTQPVILLGLALPSEDGLELHQFLLEDVDQELAALNAFADRLQGREALLTYNGKSFDVPFVERRLNFYGQNRRIDRAHFDLYHFTRRAWSDELPNCKLNTVEEKVVGVKRPVDIPSAMVPKFYTTYLEEGNPGPLVPILEHNRQDIVTLAKLFGELGKEITDG